MKDKQTQKENLKREAENKLELLRIHQTLLVEDSSSSVKEDLMSHFRFVGNYLNDIQEELMDAILYIQTAKEEHEFIKQQLSNSNSLPYYVTDIAS